MKTTLDLNKDQKSFFRPLNQNWIEYLASVFLWQESIPPKISLFLFAAGRLQLGFIIIFGMFYYSTALDSHDNLTKFVQSLASLLVGGDIITSKQDDLSIFGLGLELVIFYIFFLLIIILLLLHGFEKGKAQKNLETIYSFLGGIHNELIYYYINIICLKGLVSDMNYYIFRQELNTRAYYSYIMFSVLILTNLIFCTISLIFRYDPFKTGNLMSCWKPSCQVMTGLFKTLQSLIIVCLDKNGISGALFWIVTLLVITIQKFALHSQFPFYHYLGMKISIIFNTTSLALGFTSAGAFFFFGMNKLSALWLIYFQIILHIIILKASLDVFESQLTSSISNLKYGVRNEDEVFRTMLMLTKVMEKGSIAINSSHTIQNADEINFFSIIKIHNESCQSKSCVCQLLLQKEYYRHWVSDMKFQISELASEILFKFFKESVDKLNKSHRIIIYLSYLELIRNISGRRALVTLFRIPRKDVSFTFRVGLDKLINRIKSDVNSYYEVGQQNVLNISKFFNYQQSQSRLTEMIQSATEDYLEFWKTLKNSKISGKKILELNKIFQEKAEHIDKFWNSFTAEFSPVYRNLALNYSTFLFNTRNASDKAYKLRKSYDEWVQKTKVIFGDETLVSKNLTDPRNIAIYVSMKKETLGNILDSSSNITTLGYKKEEIIGKSVDTLMINCLQSHHHKALQKLIDENPKTDILNSNRKVFAKKKEGDVIVLNSYIALCPQFKDELIYLGLFREPLTENDYLIVNNKGHVDGFSRGIVNKFNLPRFNNLTLYDLFADPTRIYNQMQNNTQSKKDFTLVNVQDSDRSLTQFNTQIDNAPLVIAPKVKTEYFKMMDIIARVERHSVLGTCFYSLELSYEKGKQLMSREKTFLRTYAYMFTANEIQSEDDLDEGFGAQNPIIVPKFDRVDQMADKFVLKLKKVLNEKKFVGNKAPLVKSYTYQTENTPGQYGIINPPSSSSIVAYESNKTFINQIEKAIYQIPKGKSLKFIKYSVLLFCFFVFILLTVCTSEIQYNNKKLSHSIEYVLKLEDTITVMTEVYLTLEKLQLYSIGMIASNRYSNVTSTDLFLKEQLMNQKSKLHDLIEYFSMEINDRDIYYSIEDNHFALKNLNYPLDFKINMIEFLRFSVESLTKLILIDDFSNAEQYDLNLMKENIIDNFVNTFKGLSQNFISFDMKKYSDMPSITYGLILTILSGIATGLFYIKIEKKFSHNQMRLFDALGKIKNSAIDEILMKIDPEIEIEIYKKSETIGSQFINSDYKKKEAHNKKVIEFSFRKTLGLKNLLFIILIIIALQSCFIILYIKNNNNRDSNDGIDGFIYKINIIIQTEITVYLVEPFTLERMLQNIISYKSISELDQTWHENYDSALTYLNRLNYIVGESSSTALIQKIMTDNLCGLIFENMKCESYNEVYTSNGIIGLTNTLLNNAQSYKQLFEDSNQTKVDAEYILDIINYKEYEGVYMNIFKATYQKLIQEIYHEILIEIDSSNLLAAIVWLVYIFIILFCILFSRLLVIKSMFEIRTLTRKLLRIIPSKIIMTNNFLKAYLRDQSKIKVDHLFNKL